MFASIELVYILLFENNPEYMSFKKTEDETKHAQRHLITWKDATLTRLVWTTSASPGTVNILHLGNKSGSCGSSTINVSTRRHKMVFSGRKVREMDSLRRSK